MTRLIQMGAIGAFVAVGVTVNAVDKKMNYVDVEAEILAVNQTCYLEKEESKKTTFTDPMECPVAEALKAAHPIYKDFKVMRDTELELWYPDPAAHAYAKTTLELRGNKSHDDLHPGDAMHVLAHKKKPGKVREI